MAHPWQTYHNPRAIQSVWRLGLIGLPLAGTWLVISLIAPVSVPLIQILGFVFTGGVIVAMFRLGSERISIEMDGIRVVPAFRRSLFIHWWDLSSVQTRTYTSYTSHGEIEDIASALFDLDGPHEVEKVFLVTRSGRQVDLPWATDELPEKVHHAWSAYLRQLGHSSL